MKTNWVIVAGIGLLGSIPLGVMLFGYFTVTRPVAAALELDPRNEKFTVSARFSYFVDSSVLVLNLKEGSNAAPVDLVRGVFQTADTLASRGRKFERVVLAGDGTPVFQIHGEDFHIMGREYGGGQNPIYLIRTLPEKLYLPSGQAAYGEWTGGLIGVVGEQMKDVTDAMGKWAIEAE